MDFSYVVMKHYASLYFLTRVVVQSLSPVWLFATPWTAAHQVSLSFTISRSLLKLMSIELVMSSNHLILCHPWILLPSIFPSKDFLKDFFQSLLMSRLLGSQSIGASASESVLPKNIQDCFPLGLTGLISLQSKGLSRVFSNTIVQMHQFFCIQLFFTVQLSHSYMTTGKTIALTFVSKVISLFFNTLSRIVITFLPRSVF